MLFSIAQTTTSTNVLFFVSLGRAAWTKHVRKGKELPEITRDNHYDFNFQVQFINYTVF